MKIKERSEGAVTVLELSGKIMGGADYERFHGEVRRLVGEGKKSLLLDFGGVSWINSTGLGLLISAYTTLRREGGQMKVCNVKDRVRSIFYVTQLNKVFESFDTCEDALASFGT